MEEKKNDGTQLSKKEQFIASLTGNSSFMKKEEINRIWTSAFRGMNYRSLIIPVIHVQDPSRNPFDTIWKSVNHNIHLVLKFNFDGIILINHGFQCKDLVMIINYAREKYPKLWIGVNFLGCTGDELEYLIKKDLLNKVDGLWISNCGIEYALGSKDIIKHSKASDRLVRYRQIQSKWKNGNGLIFGGIEYDKCNANINDYDRLCKKLGKFASKGFMHCLSTSAITDYYKKIECFKNGIKDKCKLAVTRGVTSENIGQYLEVADAIFINKDLSDDDNFFNFNEFKLSRFRNAVKKYYEGIDEKKDEIEEKKVDGVAILSPVNEEPEIAGDSRFATSSSGSFNKFNKGKVKDDEEFLYQIYIKGAEDVNNDLNGLYKAIFDEERLPQIKHKTDSLFTPNFMYYLKSIKTENEYGIFIIPSLEEMNIYKPTWVIAQINCNKSNNDKNKAQEPIYYFASQVDFKKDFAMKIPSSCDEEKNKNWLIVGDDGSNEINMRLRILKLKNIDERRKNYSSMYHKRQKQSMIEQIKLNKDRPAPNNKEEETKKEEEEEEKKKVDPQIFDVDDHKISMVEEVGHDNILRVTDDLEELKREWNESELGNHDELEMFLGAIGKVIDIEEDDDTVKLEWSNNDCHWLPVRACWIKWKDKKITAPNFYPDQDENIDDSKLLNTAFGGDWPQ